MAHCHDGTDELDRRFGNRDFVGLVFNRYGRSWLVRQTPATGVGDVTYTVGGYGPNLGFHFGGRRG